MNNGGPAFPIPPIDNGPGNIKSQAKPGMTLRDWFAGLATDEDVDEYGCYYSDGNTYTVSRAVARYRYADAMLKARETSE
jgi:hypothetical protein